MENEDTDIPVGIVLGDEPAQTDGEINVATEVRDNGEMQGNEYSSAKKNLMFGLIGFIFVLVVFLGVLIVAIPSEDKGLPLDDSFCSEFGVTDDLARNLIRQHSTLSETVGINGEIVVTLEIDRTKQPGLRQLTCLPSEAFDDSLFESTNIQAITLKHCPIHNIHPNAFAFNNSEGIDTIDLINLPFKELPENFLSPLKDLKKLTFNETKLKTIPQNIVGDIQLLEFNLFENRHLFELPTFLKQQNELEVVNIEETDILVLEEDNFGDVSNLKKVLINDVAISLNRLRESEIASNLGVRDEVVDSVFTDRGVCRRINVASDSFARDEILRLTEIDEQNQIISFVEGSSAFTIVCFPPRLFANFAPDQKEVILSFTNGSLSFEADILRTHPDSFKDDIYGGITSLSFIDVSFTEPFVDNQFEKFVNLEHFELNNARNLGPIEAKIFGDNCNLKSIKAEISFGLRQIPIFISDCPDIEVIDVSGSTRLQFLEPKTFENLNFLKSVNFTGTEVALTHTVEEIAAIIGVDVGIIEV